MISNTDLHHAGATTDDMISELTDIADDLLAGRLP